MSLFVGGWSKFRAVEEEDLKDDLKSQVEFLRQYANAKGIIVDEVMEKNYE